MESFKITGGKKLSGSLQIESSKNSLLPIIAASLLCCGKVTLLGVPQFADINNMLKIISNLGAKIEFLGDNLVINPTSVNKTSLPKELAGSLRASVLMLGSLLASKGIATTYLPGGCKIGQRPIDLHLSGFKTLGIEHYFLQDKLVCFVKDFTGGRVNLKVPSVGATENIIMSACLAEGTTTIISGAAKEPEIVDLCNFINCMGGNIFGAGTDEICIIGVKTLGGVTYRAIGDRIIAGTYLIAAAMCGGEVYLKNVNEQQNKIIIDILSNLGCKIIANSDNIYISSSKKLALKSNSACGYNLQTQPYPGFATDMQSQTMAMLATVPGTHYITENMFENRFNHILELNALGANITAHGKVATIVGKPNCYKYGCVKSHDLRGGAAVVLAGLAGKGVTTVTDVEYIDRGYYQMEQKLSSLGAKIERVKS